MRSDSYTIPVEAMLIEQLVKWFKHYIDQDLPGTQGRDGLEMAIENILESTGRAWWTDDGK